MMTRLSAIVMARMTLKALNKLFGRLVLNVDVSQILNFCVFAQLLIYRVGHK